MPELMDGLLDDPVEKSVRIRFAQTGYGDNRPRGSDVRVPEDELVPFRAEILRGHRQDCGPAPRREPHERFCAQRSPDSPAGPAWHGDLPEDFSADPESSQPTGKLRKETLRHLSYGEEPDLHPFTTPRGTMRATIFVRPAPSATRTTSSTFLYAPGASSTIPAWLAAWR